MRKMKIVMIAAFLAGIARDFPAAGADRKGDPKSGTIINLFADYAINMKYDPFIDARDYLAKYGDLTQTSDENLEKARAMIEYMRQHEAKNWKVLQNARVANRAKIPLDDAFYVGRMWTAANDRLIELKQVDEDEAAAFRAKFGVKKGENVDPAIHQIRLAQWKVEPEYLALERKRSDIETRFKQNLDTIRADYRNKTDPGERIIDRLEKETFGRYQSILQSQKTVQAEIDRRKGLAANPPPPADPDKQVVSGGLKLTCASARYDAKVGESVEIVLEISGGKPDYALSVTKLDGASVAETGLSQPGTQTVPVSFDQEGTHTVYVAVRDKSFPVNEARLTLTFRITDDKHAPDPQPSPAKPPVPAPTTPPQPPPYTPWKLPPGSYRGELYFTHDFGGSFRNGFAQKSIAFPVTFSFDASGKISGEGHWTLSDAEKDTKAMAQYKVSPKRQIDFRFEGSETAATGEITIRVTKFHVEGNDYWQQYDSNSQQLIDVTMKLDGLQLGDPRLSEALPRRLAFVNSAGFLKTPITPATMETQAQPNFRTDANGSVSFDFKGWAGLHEISGQGKTAQIVIGKSGGGTMDVLLHKLTDSGKSVPARVNDITQSTKKAWSKVDWYLKVLGTAPPPVKPEAPPQPTSPTPAPIKGELAGFGIWPLEDIAAKPGEAFELDAMGVFLNDPYDAVNLNDKATWTLPDGLVRGPDGKVKATKPGTYEARVSITRPDGHVMSDTIRITVK